jgi:hypothetical protein
MTVIEDFVADPIGGRVAWSNWGETIGWTPQQYGPVRLPAGRKEWLRVIYSTEPAQLGMAWQALEERENHEQKAREPEWPNVQKEEKGTEMPVIAWTETTVLEPGYYPAQIKTIEETTSEFPDEKNPGKTRTVHQLKFVFSILDEEGRPAATAGGNPEEQWGWCSATWGPRSKLLAWAKILLKKGCPQPGEGLDWELLLGKKCDIEIVQKETSNGPRTSIAGLYAFRSMSQADDS